MLEPAKNVISSNFLNGFRQSIVKFSLGPSLERAQGFLDLCNAVLNWIEVRRVSRNMQDLGAGSFNQTDGPRGVMELHIVEQDDVADSQYRDEQMLDIQLKDLGVNRACNHHWGANSAQPHRTDGRDVLAVIERLNRVRALADRGARPRAHHRDVASEFIDEDQTLDGECLLFLPEGRALNRIRFVVAVGLFFLVSPSACKPRQIVLWLTSTRAVFFICSHSSSSVASGVSAIKSVKLIRAGSVNFALAPPPCGNGAMSPRSRFWRNSL